MTLKVTSDMVTSLDASKISGTLPALDGSSLTGITVGFADVTSSTDPLYNTNPAGGVGTIHMNTTTGQLYICTDATTDLNVWTNVGGGSGDVEPYIFHFTGSTYGFVAGGNIPGVGEINVIQKFPFATQTNSTDHGDLSVLRAWNSGASSSTDGYSSGAAGTVNASNIDKFSFASNVTATNHGDFPTAWGIHNGQHGGHSSETHGFTSGGGGTDYKTITKYSFSTINSVVDHGDLISGQKDYGGMSSPTHGYTSGGYAGPPGVISRIDRFAYATASTVSAHGDLSGPWRYGSNCSSETDGFICGNGNSGFVAAIEKVSWASNTTAASHGNLSVARIKSIGQSEKTHGFVSGGDASNSASNVIDKFSYGSNTTSADNADLFTAVVYRGSGHQV